MNNLHHHAAAPAATRATLVTLAVTAAIVGARRPEQIEETAVAADWELSESDLQEVDAILGQVAVPQLKPLR